MRRAPMLAALLFAAALVGCKSGKLTKAIEDVEDAGDIEDLCDEFEDQIDDDRLEIMFAATTGECPWGVDDNLDMEDTYLTARIEQVESLDLDDQVVICDMDMDLSGLVPGEVQLMVYDDYFYFTFNDIVLASSHGESVYTLPTDEGMPVYDWADIVGLPFPHGDSPFCLGEEEGDAECDIPSTETQGPISLAFDSDVISELSARALDEGRFDFGFVTTGDNDPDTDCQHAEFGFTVDVEYIED